MTLPDLESRFHRRKKIDIQLANAGQRELPTGSGNGSEAVIQAQLGLITVQNGIYPTSKHVIPYNQKHLLPISLQFKFQRYQLPPKFTQCCTFTG
jgi:hypothetical protein